VTPRSTGRSPARLDRGSDQLAGRGVILEPSKRSASQSAPRYRSAPRNSGLLEILDRQDAGTIGNIDPRARTRSR